jgi:hypothetical protein
MKRPFIKAFNALKKAGVPVYEHVEDNGNFSISSEDAESFKWVDYYAEFPLWRGESMNPVLHNMLYRHNLYAEWVNPGRLSVYQN